MILFPFLNTFTFDLKQGSVLLIVFRVFYLSALCRAIAKYALYNHFRSLLIFKKKNVVKAIWNLLMYFFVFQNWSFNSNTAIKAETKINNRFPEKRERTNGTKAAGLLLRRRTVTSDDSDCQCQPRIRSV